MKLVTAATVAVALLFSVNALAHGKSKAKNSGETTCYEMGDSNSTVCFTNGKATWYFNGVSTD